MGHSVMMVEGRLEALRSLMETQPMFSVTSIATSSPLVTCYYHEDTL